MEYMTLTKDQALSLYDLLGELEQVLDEGGEIKPDSELHRRVEIMTTNINITMVEQHLHGN